MGNVGIKNFVKKKKNFVSLIHLLEFFHESVWSFVLPGEDGIVGGRNAVDLHAFLKAVTWTSKSKFQCLVDLGGHGNGFFLPLPCFFPRCQGSP